MESVALAIKALKPFYPTRKEARELLKSWSQRDSLAVSDVRKVLAAFPSKR